MRGAQLLCNGTEYSNTKSIINFFLFLGLYKMEWQLQFLGLSLTPYPKKLLEFCVPPCTETSIYQSMFVWDNT